MRPSLVYVDAASGHLIGEHRLARELHLLSIRHLSVAPDDTVGIAMQYEGPRADRVPLVGLQRADEPIRLVHAPEPVLRRMRQYCGSVCMDREGEVMAVSSPRGSVFTFWEVSSGRYSRSMGVADGCGVAPADGAGRFVEQRSRWRVPPGCLHGRTAADRSSIYRRGPLGQSSHLRWLTSSIGSRVRRAAARPSMVASPAARRRMFLRAYGRSRRPEVQGRAVAHVGRHDLDVDVLRAVGAAEGARLHARADHRLAREERDAGGAVDRLLGSHGMRCARGGSERA